MEWINNWKEQPAEPGKYIVKTQTAHGFSHTFNCEWSGKHWGCTGQIVSHWLKE